MAFVFQWLQKDKRRIPFFAHVNPQSYLFEEDSIPGREEEITILN